jgi:hypothetical protein
MEAEHAADIFAEIVPPLAAGRAGAAGQRAEHHDRLAHLEARDARPDACDLAGRLGADHHGKLALGEGHAAVTPEVEVIERDRTHADLHLAGGGRRRIGDVEHVELAFLDEAEGTHSGMAGPE